MESKLYITVHVYGLQAKNEQHSHVCTQTVRTKYPILQYFTYLGGVTRATKLLQLTTKSDLHAYKLKMFTHKLQITRQHVLTFLFNIR
jgi:hypothetical protein